jgi:hypothetical protein
MRICLLSFICFYLVAFIIRILLSYCDSKHTKPWLHLALLYLLDILQFHGQVFTAIWIFLFFDFIIPYPFLLCFVTASINKPGISCNPFHDRVSIAVGQDYISRVYVTLLLSWQSFYRRRPGLHLTRVYNVATIMVLLSHHIKKDVRIRHFELVKIQD